MIFYSVVVIFTKGFQSLIQRFNYRCVYFFEMFDIKEEKKTRNKNTDESLANDLSTKTTSVLNHLNYTIILCYLQLLKIFYTSGAHSDEKLLLFTPKGTVQVLKDRKREGKMPRQHKRDGHLGERRNERNTFEKLNMVWWFGHPRYHFIFNFHFTSIGVT
jgi:hypothetical protein